MNSRYKGIFFITLSALSFAFMNAFVRLSGDLPSVQKSFFRNLVAFFIALIMIIRSKDGFKIEKGNLKYMILRATFGTVGILCNFYAVDHLVLSDASMLNKMSPFFVIIFSFLLLKEKMSPAQALAVAGAFIGSLFVIKPTFTNMALVPSLSDCAAGSAQVLLMRWCVSLGREDRKVFGCNLLLGILVCGYTAISASGFPSDERLADLNASRMRDLRLQADSSELRRLIIMHLRKRYPFMIIRRLFFRRSSDSFLSGRCRIGIACWGM